ncbi:MAG: hypothetical protein A2Y60_01820 [Chloroflexi bacterium RBG_13_54_9]|nr:MAG: hypothetical protein A2Y60_01820 [Chloroflexi bacterium RBG_13_54_9]
MALSLTYKQLIERLAEPHRIQLLNIAFREDLKQAFATDSGRITRKIELPVDGKDINWDIDISDALLEFASSWLLRVVDLVYDENLDG